MEIPAVRVSRSGRNGTPAAEYIRPLLFCVQGRKSEPLGARPSQARTPQPVFGGPGTRD